MRKKKIESNRSYKVIHWIMFGFLLLNLFVIFCFERDRAPRIVREEIVIITNRAWVVTNTIIKVSSSNDKGIINVDSNQVTRLIDPRYQVPISYHMSEVNHKKYIKLGDFTFTIGDVTSYGGIVDIFPDRVCLDNGIYLVNKDFDERFGFSENSIRYRKQLLDDSIATNTSHVIPFQSWNDGGNLPIPQLH